MSQNIFLGGPSILPTSGKPQRLVVLLHGYGANGDDLIGLGLSWREQLPDAEFLAPHAPFECEMSPSGRQWFSLGDWQPLQLLAGVSMAAPLLNSYLDQALETRGLTPHQLALVGFSQGTMMALYASLSRERPVGAVLGYSGALIYGAPLGSETHAPTMLVHGMADECVPFDALHDATARLQAMGSTVESHALEGLGHNIDQRGLDLGCTFLRKHLYSGGMSASQEARI